MSIPLSIAFLFFLVFLPQWWVKKVFSDFQGENGDFPGTAGEFVEHIIASFEIPKALVKISSSDNHFDPEAKVIALTAEYYHGKSLTAIAIAAHEIGHLIQLEQGSPWIGLRTKMVLWAQKLDRFGVIALFLMPFAAILTRSPLLSLAFMGLGFSGLLMNVLAHLVTLPMELDASFAKALPLLKAGQFITTEDEPKVKRILWAAALTYLATALSSLLSLARWLRVFRR